MNCERELITAAVAATAPLTITKYNVTIEKEMTMFKREIFYNTRIFLETREFSD